MDIGAALPKERRGGQNGAATPESAGKINSSSNKSMNTPTPINKTAIPSVETHGHSALATLLVREVDDYGSADQGVITPDSHGDPPLLLTHPHLAIEGEILSSCFARFDQIERQIRNILEDAADPIVLQDQKIPIVGSFQVMSNTIASLRITGTHDCGRVVTGMRLAEEVPIFLYHLHDEDPSEGEMDGEEDDDSVPNACREWQLPARQLEGLWDSLVFSESLSRRALQYAELAIRLGDAGVNTNLVSAGKMLIFHGPPGTGKTSLGRALAQKLAIRHTSGDGKYRSAVFVEIDAHSLFSKWFSESGKLVARVFARIRDHLASGDVLVIVLVDEVESLAAARSAALANSEPSDAVRAVNSLLTQLDVIRRYPGALVITTSNLVQALDEAFVDRADLLLLLDLPSSLARYEIIRSAVQELLRCGILKDPSANGSLPKFKTLKRVLQSNDRHGDEMGNQGGINGHQIASPSPNGNLNQGDLSCVVIGEYIARVVETTQGFSGRSLRRLPLAALAETAGGRTSTLSVKSFCSALIDAATLIKSDKDVLENGRSA